MSSALSAIRKIREDSERYKRNRILKANCQEGNLAQTLIDL